MKDENTITMKDLIQAANDWIEDFTNEDGSIDQKRKSEVIEIIQENTCEGTYGVVEGLIVLSLIDGLDQYSIPSDLMNINVQAYPQFKTVQRAINRRENDVPMYCLLDSFVIDDFLKSYCKKSISFQELVYRLVMLGRVPYSDYFRMTPKQRRELGTDVALFHIW